MTEQPKQKPISKADLDARIAKAKELQKKGRAEHSSTDQGQKVYEYLKQHGSIRSDNPLLAQLNPKYPTDSVWTYCAINMRDQLAADGFVIISTGRKPTTYTLVAL